MSHKSVVCNNHRNTDHTVIELSQSPYSRRKDHQFDRSDASLSNLFNDLNILFKGCPYQECYIE